MLKPTELMKLAPEVRECIADLSGTVAKLEAEKAELVEVLKDTYHCRQIKEPDDVCLTCRLAKQCEDLPSDGLSAAEMNVIALLARLEKEDR